MLVKFELIFHIRSYSQYLLVKVHITYHKLNQLMKEKYKVMVGKKIHMYLGQ